MVKVLVASLAFIIIALIDGSEIYKTKDRKKISVYLSVFLVAVILNLLIIMGVNIPNPLEPLKNFIISVFGKN